VKSISTETSGTDVRLIQLADVGVRQFLDKSRKFISAETAGSLGVTYLKTGDVLISRMADPLARACVFPTIQKPAITAVDVAIARCDGSTAIPVYLMHVSNSHGVLMQAEEVAVGTTRKRISRKNLEQVRVPLAPLAEQRRIVAKLEKLLGQVDTCQQRLTKIPLLLKRFRQSVLAAACSGRLTADWRGSKALASAVPPVNIGLPEDTECLRGWAWQKLTDIARLESGHTPRKTVSEYWDGGDVPWICLQDIRAAHGTVITDTKLKPTMQGIDNSSARMLPPGTVVFSRDISVGYAAIMGVEMATSQHFANWICSSELSNRFLLYALMASRDHLVSSQQGSTVGTIYMPALKDFYVLRPPLPEQQEIVRRIESLFTVADRIETRFAVGQKRVDSITQAILAKAFRGELVPTEAELAKVEGRSFESAEELLARIKRNGQIEEGEKKSKSRRLRSSTGLQSAV
jgi:type I restriction enzyme S subunit